MKTNGLPGELGAWHALASRFGDGLKPELAALLLQRQEGATPLPVTPVSSGPAEQEASDAMLEAAGIPRLHTPAPPEKSRLTSR